MSDTAANPDSRGQSASGDNQVNPSTQNAQSAAEGKSRLARREEAARDALRTFVRDLFFKRFGCVRAGQQTLELTFRAKVDPGQNWKFEFDPVLEEQVTPQLEEWQAERGVYIESRVYCYRCESSQCNHASPPSPMSVFSGYAPNGIPEWKELGELLSEAGDPETEELYRPVPAVLARVQLGSKLRERQLSSFGRSSKTYSILGQVIAGYFVDGQTQQRPEKVAVTLQIVETRDRDGRMELRLNPIAILPSGLKVSERLAEGWQPGLARSIAVARKQLAYIQETARTCLATGDRNGAQAAFRTIPSVLHRLALSLQRSLRQEVRRTRHAEERRKERPVHKALEDVKEATPQAFFFDEKAGTFVVYGAQSRVHIFAPDGRHVTSLRLRPSLVEARLRKRRWRHASPDEIAGLRERIESYIPRDAS